MRKYLVLSLVAIAFIVFSCNNKANPDPSPPTTPVKGKKLKTTLVAKGFYSGFDKPVETVIRDNGAFLTSWAKAYEGQSNITKPPRIDFEKEMVLLVSMGTRNSGGFDIEITEVSAEGGKVIAKVVTKSPEGMATMALTQPYHMVRVEKRNETVVFKR